MNQIRIAAPIACFMLEDMRTARYVLRRYAGDSKCALPLGYHNAESDSVAERPEVTDKPYTGTNPPEIALDDPRWPTACACGYAFTPEDARQVFAHGLYSRVDTGKVMTWDEAPAGAIRDASWWPDKGADGHAWGIKLPDGNEWMTESSASNCVCRTKDQPPEHRCWSRSGVAPILTVSPSLGMPRWHGWLRDGKLVQA